MAYTMEDHAKFMSSSATSGPGDVIGLPDYQYQGDSPFGAIFKDFYDSGAGYGPQTADMRYNPFTGKHGSSSHLGDMHRFISGAYNDMQGQMTNKEKKSQDFLDKFKMYGDAMNTYNDYQSEQEKEQSKLKLSPGGGGIADLPPPTANPIGTQLPGPIAEINNMDIATTGNGIFNPIPPMTNPIAPPPTMNSGHSHDGLLSGIGDLFKQYFPNQGQTSQSNLGQPNFSNNHSYTQSFNGPGILGLITPQRS